MKTAYQTIKTRKGMLKHLKLTKLITMSIYLDSDETIVPVYLVADPQYDKDLGRFAFSTFDSQEELNDYLEENPSGMFLNPGGVPLNWNVLAGNPTYQFREFEVGKGRYLILKIHDMGLNMNLLLGNTYALPYMLKPESELNKEDSYNLSELFNLGLLGRIMGANLNSPMVKNRIALPEQVSVTNLVNKDYGYNKNRDWLTLFNGGTEPTYLKGFKEWKQVRVINELNSIQEWEAGNKYPDTVYELKSGYDLVHLQLAPFVVPE